jgi:hypothetical protein
LLTFSEYGLNVTPAQNKPQTANRAGKITAMVQIGSVGGALIAFIACDKIGAFLVLLSVWTFSNINCC